MNRTYDDIPRQGTHRAERTHEEPTTNVRAQEAVEPSALRGEPAYRLSYSAIEGTYRLRLAAEQESGNFESGYEEIGLFPADLRAAYDRLPGPPQITVFENLETGEVVYEGASDLLGDWTREGRFDQATIFADESAAEEYVRMRRNES